MTNLSLYTSKAFKILFTYHIIHNTLYLNFPKVNIDIDNFNCQCCCKILICIPVQRSSKGIRIIMISKCFQKDSGVPTWGNFLLNLKIYSIFKSIRIFKCLDWTLVCWFIRCLDQGSTNRQVRKPTGPNRPEIFNFLVGPGPVQAFLVLVGPGLLKISDPGPIQS